MTIEQDWARERNGLKKSIKGMLSKCGNMSSCFSFLGSEKDYIEKVEKLLNNVILGWDERNKYSKRKYLREVSK